MRVEQTVRYAIAGVLADRDVSLTLSMAINVPKPDNEPLGWPEDTWQAFDSSAVLTVEQDRDNRDIAFFDALGNGEYGGIYPDRSPENAALDWEIDPIYVMPKLYSVLYSVMRCDTEPPLADLVRDLPPGPFHHLMDLISDVVEGTTMGLLDRAREFYSSDSISSAAPS